MITRKEIINSNRTLECFECGYILIGFDPVEYILCDPCYKKEKEERKDNYDRQRARTKGS